MLGGVDPHVVKATDSDYPDHVAFIPNDDGNKEWRDYQAWLAKGNEPTPATIPATAPSPSTTPISVTITKGG
jgi:hypothetical protein